MLETLAVLFLASRFPAVAPFIMTFASSDVDFFALWLQIRQLLENDFLLSQCVGTLNVLGVLFFNLLGELRPECKRVSNKNLFFCLKSHFFMIRTIVAATAPTMTTTISVVFEAFTIELEAPGVRTIASLYLVLLIILGRRLDLDLM